MILVKGCKFFFLGSTPQCEIVRDWFNSSCNESCSTAQRTSPLTWPRALPARLRSNIKPALTDSAETAQNGSVTLKLQQSDKEKLNLCDLTIWAEAVLLFWMELTVAGDGVRLAAYRPRPTAAPQPGTNQMEAPAGFREAAYHQRLGDGSGVASRGSDALTGYETLDSPPHYDFYANTEVWGRRRRFRPSLYQLYAKPEVRTPSWSSKNFSWWSQVMIYPPRTCSMFWKLTRFFFSLSSYYYIYLIFISSFHDLNNYKDKNSIKSSSKYYLTCKISEAKSQISRTTEVNHKKTPLVTLDRTRTTPDLPCTRRQQVSRWGEETAQRKTRTSNRNHRLNLLASAGCRESWYVVCCEPCVVVVVVVVRYEA